MEFNKFIIQQIWYQDCYCGDNIKCRFLSKHLFQRMQQHGSCKSPQSNCKLL